MKTSRKYLLISILSVITFFLIWHMATEWLKLMPSFALPSPGKVFATFIKKFTSRVPDGATLLEHLAASLSISVSGFLAGALIGVPLGIAMAWNHKVDLIVRPLFDLIRPVPPVAWIPVMIILFGIGTAAKAAIIFLAALVPCVINSYTGIQQVKDVHIWVGRIFGASRRDLLLKIAIPTAMPNIFTGLRVALGASWVSLVAAEMLAATRGLGYMIQIGRMMSRPDIVVVGMVFIGFLGAMLSLILTKIEEKFVRGR